MRLLLCLFIAASCSLSGCASIQEPYAELDTSRTGRADIDESSVVITGYGSQMNMRPQTHVMLEPGKQLVSVRTLRSDARIRSKIATLAIDAKPCLRYFVVAKHPVGANPQDWYVEITRTEPIPECQVATPVSAK
ncbi:MAG: hypothetical protein RL500_743 [Pseudomonadota bacterium]|jgi:hypothetical protein